MAEMPRPPSGSSSGSQPAVVPLFPWQRRRGAAELQSEVMIYKMGGGVRKEGQVVGGEGREYWRKRMLGKKRGIWRRTAAVVETAGTRGGQMCKSVSFVSVSFGQTGCGKETLWSHGHRSIRHIVIPTVRFTCSLHGHTHIHTVGYTHLRTHFVPLIYGQQRLLEGYLKPKLLHKH